jgi:hypothetical protein
MHGPLCCNGSSLFSFPYAVARLNVLQESELSARKRKCHKLWTALERPDEFTSLRYRPEGPTLFDAFRLFNGGWRSSNYIFFHLLTSLRRR